MTSGAELIKIERERQISMESWTCEHDDRYVSRELVAAAICYAMNRGYFGTSTPPNTWPWAAKWWKPQSGQQGNIRNLVKAGALIAAEIDRLQRLLEQEQP